MKTLEETGNTLNAIETSIEFLSSKYNDLTSKVETQGKALEDLREKTTVLESPILEKNAEIRELRTAVDNGEQ